MFQAQCFDSGKKLKDVNGREDYLGREQPWERTTMEEVNHGSGKPWNRTTMEEDNLERGQP